MSPNWAGVTPVETAEADGHRDRSEQPVGTAVDVLQVKVSLRGMRPPIWRRLEVPGRVTLAGLHTVLQTAFGWTDSLLHGFEVNVGGRRPRLDPPQRTLSQFLSRSSSARVRRPPRTAWLSTRRTLTAVPERGFAELESV